MTQLSRRRFTKLALATTAAPAVLGGLGRRAFADTRLRLFWWGNPERETRTLGAVDLYQDNNPEVAIDAESLAWGDYWPKMATQAAGGNLADVVQMDYRYLFEYARRNQLEALDPYVGSQIDLTGFDESSLESGRVDGKLVALPMGFNSKAGFYDKAKLDELGITPPDVAWTYDDLKALAAEVKKAELRNYWGVADKGHWEPILENFLIQRGKGLYNEDGQIAFTEEDVADFFGFWDGLRQEGLAPPADVSAQDTGEMDKMPIVSQQVAFDFAHSNQLVAIQALTPNELGMLMLPNLAGGQPGQYLKPAMQISVAATSQNKEEAAKLAGFIVTDLGAGEILGVERGVPGDKRVREHISGKVDPLESKMVEYLDVVGEYAAPLPPPPPKGAGEIEVMQIRLYPQIAFGRLSVQEAAAQYMREAESILRRS